MSLGPKDADSAAENSAPAACDEAATVVDRPPDGLNVRARPGREFEITENLPNQDIDGNEFHIIGKSFVAGSFFG